MDVSSSAAAAELPKLTLNVLSFIKTAQMQNGLRHGDYQRYRRYCSRRLARIRASTGFHYGKGRFQKKEITADIVADVRYLEMVLVNAERAWGYAMQLKDDNTNASEPNTRAKFHIIRRLKKASSWASLLESLCAERADAHTSLEAQAYAAWLAGNYLLEREEWQPSLSKFVLARTIYSQLGEVADPLKAEVYLSRVEQIDPSIQYCEFNLKNGSVASGDLMSLKSYAHGPEFDLLNAKLESMLAEARKKQVQQLSSIEFRGRSYQVRTEAIKVALLQAQDLSRKLPQLQDKLPAYSDLFSCLDDALKHLKAEIAQVKASDMQTSKSQEYLQELESFKAAVTCEKLEKVIERNQLMVQVSQSKLDQDDEIEVLLSGGKPKNSRPEELVRLYDNLIQSLSELSSLPGSFEQPNARKIFQAKESTFKAHRCFYLSLSYGLMVKWAECLALLDRSTELANNAINAQNALPDSDKAAIDQLNAIIDRARGLRLRIHGRYLQQSMEQEHDQKRENIRKDKRTLMQRSDEFNGGAEELGHSIAPLPPSVEPVPCKPYLFDLAFNCLEFPDVSGRFATQKKAGFLARSISRLWGSK
eukprot:GILI01007802.1.p1 GENE.GILI01007802.1~~GILI01007802.1.p1  ORF type:complete len:613 (+),score=188.26 GILI01007802.1:74-1840(+)